MPRSPIERWRDADSGTAYATRRWASPRRAQRDPRLVERLLDRLGSVAPGPGARVLDVPAGTGRLHATLAARGYAVVSADASLRMLGAIEGDAPRLAADAHALPFPDRAFDLVVCCRLLHHLDEPSSLHAVTAELVRVSRGLVVASFWDAAAWSELARRARGRLVTLRPRGRIARPRTALRVAFAAAGAEVVAHAASLRFVSRQTFLAARVPPA